MRGDSYYELTKGMASRCSIGISTLLDQAALANAAKADKQHT